MARFNLSKPYTMDLDDVRGAAESLVERLQREHGVRCNWGDECVSLSGKGVDGHLDFSGGTVDVDVKMGMLASAFQGVLKKEVQRYLDKYIS